MIVREISWRAPLSAFAPLAGAPFAHLVFAGGDGRWRAIVASPVRTLEWRAGRAYIDGAHVDGDPFDLLQRETRLRRADDTAGAPAAAFLTGAVGHVDYDLGALIEPAVPAFPPRHPLPQAAFGFYDAAAVFDCAAQRAWIVCRPDAAARARRLETALAGEKTQETAPPVVRDMAQSMTPEAYEAAVSRVVERILNGDLFQANISQRFRARLAENPSVYGLFRRLCAPGLASHAALIQYADGAILSNSPERFFRVGPDREENRIVAQPIKGTRPRGASREEDAALAQALVRDEKDRAENIMITDLVRNDLSAICREGSIREDEICGLRSYPHVHHLVSTVSGTLRPDADAVDAFRAQFPCGSITGAPKIRAMQVIAEEEGAARGPYCGAVGWIDDRGGADFSVAIRTAVVARDEDGAYAEYSAGGGVTALSKPADERREALDKARAFLEAVRA